MLIMSFDNYDVVEWLDNRIKEKAEEEGENIDVVVRRLTKKAGERGMNNWVRILNKYIVNKKRIAQRKYTKKHDRPLFSPRSGHCYFCGNQIYNRISLEKAGNELIIHCPYCKGCYCD